MAYRLGGGRSIRLSYGDMPGLFKRARWKNLPRPNKTFCAPRGHARFGGSRLQQGSLGQALGTRLALLLQQLEDCIAF